MREFKFACLSCVLLCDNVLCKQTALLLRSTIREARRVQMIEFVTPAKCTHRGNSTQTKSNKLLTIHYTIFPGLKLVALNLNLSNKYESSHFKQGKLTRWYVDENKQKKFLINFFNLKRHARLKVAFAVLLLRV